MKIEIIQALTDNYIFFLTDTSNKTAVVDPGESEPVLSFLESNKIDLDYIFVTHHHWDHTDGIKKIKEITNAKVIGGDSRISNLDSLARDGDKISLGNSLATVIEIPGHTLGHIAFYFADAKSLFSGDTLFSLGCGRLFEGSPEQMMKSLKRLSELPSDTKVFCGHEYTEKNCQFALNLKPESKALLEFQMKIKNLRSRHLPTIPSTIGIENELNPFLLALQDENALGRFTEIRNLRNHY